MRTISSLSGQLLQGSHEVFCPFISGVEPGTQEALTREADECMGRYAQRICSFKGTLVVVFFFFFFKHFNHLTCQYDVGLIKVIDEVTENKLGCVFGNVLLVTSISNVGGSSGLHLWNESRPCLPMASHFHGPFPTCKMAS